MMSILNRVLLAVTCAGAAIGCVAIALLLRPNWDVTLLCWSGAFFFLMGTYAAIWRPSNWITLFAQSGLRQRRSWSASFYGGVVAYFLAIGSFGLAMLTLPNRPLIGVAVGGSLLALGLAIHLRWWWDVIRQRKAKQDLRHR